MSIRLQMLHALMEAHPDRAERLRPHVEALEAAIEAEPGLCLHRVRALFEAAHLTLEPLLSLQFGRHDGFPGRMRQVIQALNFSIENHPNAAEIHEHIDALLKAIDDTAVALAKLSNIPNLRHGGSLDWATLERQHAAMLGGLCDTLVAFLFEIAWGRLPEAEAEPADAARYDDFTAFNEYLDDEHDLVELAGAQFQPSLVLFQLDRTQYDLVRQEWAQEAEAAENSDEAAA